MSFNLSISDIRSSCIFRLFRSRTSRTSTKLALSTFLLVSLFSLGNALAQDQSANNEINVRNADLSAIVKIFSRKTKRNYILDESVKGKVTIFLPGRVSDSESIKILESILSLKGYTSVPIGENLWKIVPRKDAKQSTVPTVIGDEELPDSAAVVTRLVRLKYVNAGDMQKLLSQLISSDGLLNAYDRTNSLIIIDAADNIDRLVQIVEAVDLPSSDQDMTIIPVKYADATQLATTLQEILGENGSDENSGEERNINLLRNRSQRISGSATAKTNTTPGSINSISIRAKGAAAKIIPDERTNSIIVVADDTQTARIRALADQLDSEIDLSGNRFYVYRCQHASAEEIADVLSGLTGQSTTSSSDSSSSLFNQATGSSRVGNSQRNSRGSSSLRTQQRLASTRRTPGRSRSENSNGSGTSTVSFGEELSITADPATNSLIIASNKTDYQKILGLLKELDIKRRQVQVEAILLEVAVNDSSSLGTDFLASAGGQDGAVIANSQFSDGNGLVDLFQNPVALSDFSVAAATSGTLTLPGGITIPTQSVLVNAARNNTNVNVLSSPNILATDNEEAEIVVGQNVPFVASTSTSVDNLNNTFNQVDRQDVGITLRITPQISSNDFVTLNLFTEVSAVIDSTASSSLGPTTTLRTSQTTVIAKDRQMIVTGGLMADDTNDTESGVPFLKDIPVLGSMFKTRTESNRKTNLLIFITPKIIRDQFDARDVTVTQRDALEDVIYYEDIYPSRKETLHRKSIDEVAEAKIYDGPKPSTIRPSSTANSYSDSAWENSTEQQSSQADQEVLEFRVAPSASRSNSSSSYEAKSKYLVFQSQLSNDASSFAKTPFAQAGARPGSVVAVITPTMSSPHLSGFFKEGQRYSYDIDGDQIGLTLLGEFSSKSEAYTVYPTLGETQWHTLSYHELMNAGVGPWRKN